MNDMINCHISANIAFFTFDCEMCCCCSLPWAGRWIRKEGKVD